jgi:hypothetical protein
MLRRVIVYREMATRGRGECFIGGGVGGNPNVTTAAAAPIRSEWLAICAVAADIESVQSAPCGGSCRPYFRPPRVLYRRVCFLTQIKTDMCLKDSTRLSTRMFLWNFEVHE